MDLGFSIYQHSPHIMRTAMLNIYACFLGLERYGIKFDRMVEQFERNEKLSRGELEEYQRERFKLLILHAYEHVPYYRDIMNQRKLVPKDFINLQDIEKLPILTREDVKKNNERLKADNILANKIRHGHTSGTTGSPLSFLWDVSVCVAHHVADWRQKRWAGFNFGDPFVSIQGRQIVPMNRSNPPFWIHNYIHNQLFISSFHLKDEYLSHIIEKIRRFKPRGVEGYPSSIYVLARYMAKNNIVLPVPAVLTSSETLLPLQRDLIEDRFKCKVFDFYGMAERVIYGSECSYHSGKHLNMDYGITEIVDAEGNPLPEGKFGTIVATGLWNFAMPLIRYKTSDSSSIRNERCACGCNFPLMDQVTTKAEDIVVLPDGRFVPSSILTHPFKPLDNIVKSQIIQNRADEIIIKIVRGHGYCTADTDYLLKEMKLRVGEDVNVVIDFVDDIPNDKSGKYRWVISKVSTLE